MLKSIAFNDTVSLPTDQKFYMWLTVETNCFVIWLDCGLFDNWPVFVSSAKDSKDPLYGLANAIREFQKIVDCLQEQFNSMGDVTPISTETVKPTAAELKNTILSKWPLLTFPKLYVFHPLLPPSAR